MKLQTIVDIKPSPWKIGYDDKILLVGSCFADEIGEQMAQRYLQVTCNPFGTLYNPLSIAQAINLQSSISNLQLINHDGLWHSMAHHGSFSRPTKEETEQAVRASIETMQQALAEATVVIVTFGTAWVYEMRGDGLSVTGYGIVGNCHKLPESCFTRRRLSVDEMRGDGLSVTGYGIVGNCHKLPESCFTRRRLSVDEMRGDGLSVTGYGIVGNCHKLPESCFTRRRLTVEEIVAAWKPILEKYPDKHWIFTVSPIRHIRDGLHENQLSKATLLQAIEQIENGQWKMENWKLHYFEAFEIMLDELRDYRFYADDLVHPSSLAVNYIWERFVDTFCTPQTKNELVLQHKRWKHEHHIPLQKRKKPYI